MKPLRLAYLVSRYPAVSHTFILREVNTLNAQDFDIHVASVNDPDRSSEQLTDTERSAAEHTYYIKRDGVLGALRAHIATLFTRPWAYLQGLGFSLYLGGLDLQKLLYCGFYFIEAVMVGQWMQQKGLQHLHVHFASQAATVGMLVKRVFGCHYSISVHGPDEFYHVDAQMLREKLLAADLVCCISYFARSQLMALSTPEHWHKYEILPLGVDPDLFQPRPCRVHPEPFEILCVGRLVPVKGQLVLLNAVHSLLQAGRQIRLRYIGDGPDRSALENAITQNALHEHVVLEGIVTQDRIRDFYQQADIFVLASFAEGVPVVLMEAMAMEIPCISTRITGIPELIVEGTGLLVKPSDEVELAAAIAQLMEDAVLREQMGKAARQYILDHYHLGENTMRLGEVFRHHLKE